MAHIWCFSTGLMVSRCMFVSARGHVDSIMWQCRALLVPVNKGSKMNVKELIDNNLLAARALLATLRLLSEQHEGLCGLRSIIDSHLSRVERVLAYIEQVSMRLSEPPSITGTTIEQDTYDQLTLGDLLSHLEGAEGAEIALCADADICRERVPEHLYLFKWDTHQQKTAADLIAGLSACWATTFKSQAECLQQIINTTVRCLLRGARTQSIIAALEANGQ